MSVGSLPSICNIPLLTLRSFSDITTLLPSFAKISHCILIGVQNVRYANSVVLIHGYCTLATLQAWKMEKLDSFLLGQESFGLKGFFFSILGKEIHKKFQESLSKKGNLAHFAGKSIFPPRPMCYWSTQNYFTSKNIL